VHNPPSVRRDTDQRHGANPHIGRPFSRRGLGTILADDRLPAGRIQAHRLKRLAGPRFAPASIRLTSRPTSIWRGRRTSGISRTSSMVSRPSVRLASVTLTWSASWKRCLNGGAPMPRCRNCRSVPDSSARRCSPSINSRFRSAVIVSSFFFEAGHGEGDAVGVLAGDVVGGILFVPLLATGRALKQVKHSVEARGRAEERAEVITLCNHHHILHSEATWTSTAPALPAPAAGSLMGPQRRRLWVHQLAASRPLDLFLGVHASGREPRGNRSGPGDTGSAWPHPLAPFRRPSASQIAYALLTDLALPFD
jgi:hypothetical protein